MDRRVTPPQRVTSPTWGPPPPCKQALKLTLRNSHVYALPFIHCLYFIYSRKFYVRSHGKITRQWKSSLKITYLSLCYCMSADGIDTVY